MLLAWGFLGVLLDNPYHLSGAHDWAYFSNHLQGAYITYTRYGQIPFWDPYFCGGVPGLGNTQSNAASPLMVLSLLLGAMPGARIGYWLLFVLGMEGTFQYARQRQILGIGALLASVLFAFSGRIVQTFADGQPALLGYLLIPWVLVCFERGLLSWRWATLGAVFMTVMFCEGGAIPTPIASIFLGISMLWAAAQCALDAPWRWYRPVLTLAVMAVITVGLSAIRFFPVAESLVLYPRVWNADEAYPPSHIISMLIVRMGGNQYFGAGSSYIGAFAFVLALLGILTRDRVAIRVGVFAFVALELAMGSENFIGLHRVLKSLPVLENLRNPFRYTVVVGFFVALGAGRTVQLLEVWLTRKAIESEQWRGLQRFLGWLPDAVRRRWRFLMVALALGISVWVGYRAAYQTVKFNHERIAPIFGLSPAFVVEDQPFKQSVGNRWVAHIWPSVNMGSLNCFEEQPYPQSALLRGDLAQEEYLEDPKTGTARELSWSPHRIEVAVNLREKGRLMVNQNYHRGWHANVGEVQEISGLLTVLLPAGEHKVVLEFSDPLMNAGMWVSLISLLAVSGAGIFWTVQAVRQRAPKPQS